MGKGKAVRSRRDGRR